jgi:hypothetical protein
MMPSRKHHAEAGLLVPSGCIKVNTWNFARRCSTEGTTWSEGPGRRAARERQRLRCVLGPDDLPAAAAYAMAPRLLTILTGRNLPRIRQSGEAEPSTIDDTTIADFTRVVDQDGKRCFPRDEIITDTKKAKPKKARRQLPSTHASVREFLNAGTISK